MKTKVLIEIEHPKGTSAEGLIDNAIKNVVSDINSDLDEGWSIEVVTDKRDRALRSAISLALSDFPFDWSNDEILEGIEEKHSYISVWEPFEYWAPESVINFIETTTDSLIDLID